MTKFGRWLHDLIGAPLVSAIEVAALHPGDLLVFHLPEKLTQDQIAALRDQLTARLPTTINCCLMAGDGVRVDIVRIVDPSSRPMQRPIGG